MGTLDRDSKSQLLISGTIMDCIRRSDEILTRMKELENELQKLEERRNNMETELCDSMRSTKPHAEILSLIRSLGKKVWKLTEKITLGL